LVVLGLAVLGVLYGPTLLDALRAIQFQPSEQIASIRNRIGLTGHGERIFYATAPAIEDKTQFNKSCQSTERTAAILGCYFKDRIYLYNIKNAVAATQPQSKLSGYGLIGSTNFAVNCDGHAQSAVGHTAKIHLEI